MPDQVGGMQSANGSDGSLADRRGTPGFPTGVTQSASGATAGGTKDGGQTDRANPDQVGR
jgi:hypothetical protein